MENKNEPAYPIVDETGKAAEIAVGLTKRELISAMAMQGILANRSNINEKTLARYSVEFADALLQELEKETDTPELLK